MITHPSDRRPAHATRPIIERRVVEGHQVWVERDAIGIVEVSRSRETVQSDAAARRAALKWPGLASSSGDHRAP
jgi:hypothetical protein